MYSYVDLRSVHKLYTDRDDQFVGHSLCLHLKVLNIVIWSYYGVENTFEPSDVLIVAFCVPAGQLNGPR